MQTMSFPERAVGLQACWGRQATERSICNDGSVIKACFLWNQWTQNSDEKNRRGTSVSVRTTRLEAQVAVPLESVVRSRIFDKLRCITEVSDAGLVRTSERAAIITTVVHVSGPGPQDSSVHNLVVKTLLFTKIQLKIPDG